MKIEYPFFYRKRGIRYIEEIAHPRMQPIVELELPYSSVYHYLDVHGNTKGPSNDDYLFKNIIKPIYVEHVFNLTSEQGGPRKIIINPAGIQRDYANQNRRTRLLRNFLSVDKARDTLVAVNYAPLAHSARYMRNPYTEHNRWYNCFATAMDKITEMSEFSFRQHFLICKAPKLIPSLSQITMAANDFNQTILKTFRTEESYLLLELWKWLSDDPSTSVFARLPLNKIHLVNLVFQENAEWTILNLGQLWAYKKPIEDTDDTENVSLQPVIQAKQKLNSQQLQKRLLRMMISIMESNTLAAPVEEIASKTVVSKLVQKAQGDDAEPEPDGEPVDTSDLSVYVPDTPVNEPAESNTLPVMIDSDDDENDTQKLIDDEDRQLDEDLASLNEIVKRKDQEEATAEKPLEALMVNTESIDFSSGIKQMTERLADDGNLSAGEYKRFMRLADGYKTMLAPDLTPLGDFVDIKYESLKIQDNITIPDSKTVFDKSMLKSSLLDFDRRYIKEVMPKHIASMAIAIQGAGVAVTEYKVVNVADAMGAYQDVTIGVSPIIGKSSVLRAKIPLVNEDGVFISGGTKYKMRKKRGDLPIRKVSPDRVALTSYYGKLFINRGKKKTNDYGHWITNRVIVKGLDKQENFIKELVMGEVFDNHRFTPRAYSALSKSIQSFKVDDWSLFFSREDLLKHTTLQDIQPYENDGSVVCGIAEDGSFMVMDEHNFIYRGNNGQVQPIGEFETFLNIGVDAPVESAGLVIYGKEIPLAVILSYQLGFEKLMRLLKVEPRRVPAGSRLNMLTHEYSIAFSDETLIFPKENRLASIILSGFNDYKNSLKLFSVYSFDKRGVYLNLMNDNGLTVRYLREIERIFKIFIDPITHQLLVQMNEPTNFDGLLFSAAKKLLIDSHPDEGDPMYMREKGYESFAGALYTELVQSLREHDGKLSKSTTALSLNPYAVWKRISEDPAKSLISEINPIEALKASEAVTLGGTGGRSRRSLTKSTRAYHKNDMGIISESTVDSSDVAINVYTSADPQYIDLLGRHKVMDPKNRSMASTFSTSALLAPASDHDD